MSSTHCPAREQQSHSTDGDWSGTWPTPRTARSPSSATSEGVAEPARRRHPGTGQQRTASTPRSSTSGSGQTTTTAFALTSDEAAGQFWSSWPTDGRVLDLEEEVLRHEGELEFFGNVGLMSPAGDRAAITGLEGGEVLILDLTTGEPVRPFVVAHQGNVGLIEFSPDGSRLVTGAEDGSVVLWDTETAIQLARVSLPGAGSGRGRLPARRNDPAGAVRPGAGTLRLGPEYRARDGVRLPRSRAGAHRRRSGATPSATCPYQEVCAAPDGSARASVARRAARR